MKKEPKWKQHIGEYINLCWEGGVEEFYVYGHVPFEDALVEIDKEMGASYYYKLEEPVHNYGRWECNSWIDNDKHVCLATHSQPGRGKFPITTFVVRRLNDLST